ncbi:MAG TPA: hypothetical protein VJZ93_00385 [Candidatus Nanoarchaeia archaeon]|nr:hypothetical protein [Candidatus Nanoarchaeia archaeon]
MVWQDFVITICIVAFSYALIPQIIDGFRKKKSSINVQTSLITALGMCTLSIVYLSLNLIFSATIVFINALIWTTFLFQKMIYKS